MKELKGISTTKTKRLMIHTRPKITQRIIKLQLKRLVEIRKWLIEINNITGMILDMLVLI